MRHPERIPELLRHLVVCANRIREVVRRTSMESFIDDYRQHDLVLRQIEIIGEIVNRIRRADHDFISAHRLVELDEAVGMRNRIAHQYEAVDLVLVWEVSTIDVPALKAAVVPLLLQLNPNADLDSLHF